MVKCSKIHFNNKVLSNLRKILDENPNREISGSLRIKKNNKNGYIISVGTHSKGSVEECDLVETMYNFHTHPIGAYKQYNTNIGWPSESDFKTFMYCFFQYKNLLHCVCALEGIYIITINPGAYDYLVNSKTKQETKQTKIDKHIESIYIDKELALSERPLVRGNHVTTPLEYIEFVNTKKFYRDTPLFKMVFMKWNKPLDIYVCNPYK